MSLFRGVALITGAASGIGRQCAISFAAEGCTRIALLDKDEEGMSETSRLCKEVVAQRITSIQSNTTSPSPGTGSSNGKGHNSPSSNNNHGSSGSANRVRTFIIPCDVSSDHEVNVSMDCVVDEWGRIDYAVNCAGVFSLTGPSHLTTPEEFDRVTSVNYRGTWLCARAEIARMMGQAPLPTHDGRPGNRGVIVNIGSNLGIVSRPDCPAYSASKAAIISMTKSDAIDYAGENIRINCVCPGVIRTPMTSLVPDDDPIVAIAPMKRMGTSQEVADAVLFLCSSKATFVHGAALSVDGGYTAN